MTLSSTSHTLFWQEVHEAASRGPRLWASMLLLAIVAFLTTALWWADRAVIDEITSGIGQVIPSRQIQVVQNLEGGILSELKVAEGDAVASGQLLAKLDPTQSDSGYRETRARYLGVLTKIARLRAEIDGGQPEFPEVARNEAPDLVAGELELIQVRRKEHRSTLDILRSQADQRREEITELEARLEPLGRSLKIASEELAITEPMVERGVTSRIELLRLQREINTLEGKIQSTTLSIAPARSAHTMALRRIHEEQENYRSKALGDLKTAQVELAAREETLRGLKDRFSRTEVRAPMAGTIKRITVNTIGGVVSPGMPLLEIVPMEDRLLVEARISPSDIAFLRVGQKARVKITAYDFSTYGGLDAVIEHISADTMVNERGYSYYIVRVRTGKNHLGTRAEPLPVIPGMIAEVDILTGRKSILDYLLNPILRMRDRAFRER